MSRRKVVKDIIAIVYDFDGTLSPKPMQEYTILPRIGIKSSNFWKNVKMKTLQDGGEEVITYMMKLLDMSNNFEVPTTKGELGKLASNIKYYSGVPTFFNRINRFVNSDSKGQVKVRHYIISSGLKEILKKISIEKYFHKIFACEYHYDHNKVPKYPKVVVTDTAKTQFLFRINKGKEKLSENINELMSEYDRPIPFSNIIYIGDGLTDVPGMTVTTKNGGYAIAVFNPKKRKSIKICRQLFEARRVEFIAKADYRNGSDLDKCIKVALSTIIQGIMFQKTQYDHMKKYIRQYRKRGA